MSHGTSARPDPEFVPTPIEEFDNQSIATAGDDPMALCRAAKGLPDDHVVLAAAGEASSMPITPPMAQPDHTWALVITAVDIDGALREDGPGVVRLVAGRWHPDRPPARAVEGDLVVRLIPNTNGPDADRSDPRVTIDMLLSRAGTWRHVGRWPHLSTDWPSIVAPTAALAMASLDADAGLATSDAGH